MIRLKRLQPVQTSAATNIDITSVNRFNLLMNYKDWDGAGYTGGSCNHGGLIPGGDEYCEKKEIGTIEQINVTPIRKYHFILGNWIHSGC